MAKAAKAPKVSIHDEIVAAIQESDDAFKPQKKKEDAQAYVRRLCESANDMAEESWEALSEGAQSYLNTTLELINNKKNKKAYPLPPGMDGADDEDDAPQPAPKAKGKAKAPVEDDDDDEDGTDTDNDADDEDDDEDEAPAPKAKAKGKPAPAPAPVAKGKKAAKAAEPEDDDEDEDEDEDEAPKKSGKGSFAGKKAAPFAPKPDGVTHKIRLAIAKHKKFTDVTTDEIRASLAKNHGVTDAKTSSINTILGDMKSTIKALTAAGRMKE